MLKIFEASPLSIFVIYISLINPVILEDWKAPFVISGLAALIVIISLFLRKIMFNRIIFGVNLYLTSGALAFITHQWWLCRIYSQLQASGMILWMIAVGILTIFFSPKGFIGVVSSDTNSIKKYSNYLLLVCVIAFAVSFGLRANRLLAGILTFTCLFSLQKSFMKTLGDADKILEEEHNEAHPG